MLQRREAMGALLPPYFGPQARSFVQDGLGWLYDFDRAIFLEALLAGVPSNCHPSFYSILCRERRIRRGPSEGQDAIVSHLRNWLTFWRLAGLPMGLMLAVQAYLAPSYPQIRIITRQGLWYRLSEGATGRMLELPGYEPLPVAFTIKTSAHERLRGSGLYERASYPGLWDWDSISHPDNASKRWHYWLTIDGSTALPQQAQYDDPDFYYDNAQESWGFAYPHGDLAVLRTIIREFSPADMRCVSTIVTPGNSYLDPASAGAGTGETWPDGHWGNEIRYDGGAAYCARYYDYRYMFSNPNE